jgi:hypothetical protein
LISSQLKKVSHKIVDLVNKGMSLAHSKFFLLLANSLDKPLSKTSSGQAPACAKPRLPKPCIVGRRFGEGRAESFDIE